MDEIILDIQQEFIEEITKNKVLGDFCDGQELITVYVNSGAMQLASALHHEDEFANSFLNETIKIVSNTYGLVPSSAVKTWMPQNVLEYFKGLNLIDSNAPLSFSTFSPELRKILNRQNQLNKDIESLPEEDKQQLFKIMYNQARKLEITDECLLEE